MSDYTLSARVTLDDELSAKIQRTKDAVGEFGRETADADGKTNTFGDTLKAVLASNLITGAVSKLTGAVKSMGQEMFNVGMSFEAQMDKVGAISGASADDVAALSEKAEELGSTTKFTATESGQAFEYMAMAGWKTSDMLDGVEGIMNLAAASGEDLATTSDIVTDALTAFGLTAKDSGHFADVLAATASNANTNVSMLGDSFKYVAPVAGTLGFRAEETAEALGLMANSGIKSSQAGTSLRKIFNVLSKDIKFTSSTLGDVEIATTNADGSMRSLNDILGDCREVFGQLSESEASSAASALFGQEAMSGFLTLMNAAPADIDKLRGAIENSSFSLDDVSSNLQQCGVDWEKYSDKAWATAGGMGGLTDEIIYNLQTLHTPLEELQGYLVNEYELDPSDALAAIQSVQTSMQDSTGTAETMAGEMQDNLTGQITSFNSAMEGLQLEFFKRLQEPLTGIVSFGVDAVRQLTAGLEENGMPGMMEAAGNIWNSFTQGVEAHMPEVISSGFDMALQLVGGLLNGLPEMALGAIEMIDTFAQGLIDKIDAVTESGDFLSGGLLSKIMSYAPRLLEAGGTLIVHLIEGLVKLSPQLLVAAGQLMIDMVKGIIEHFPEFLEAGAELNGKIIQGFGSAAKDAGKWMLDYAYQWLDDLGVIDWLRAGRDIAKGIAQGIRNAANDIWNALLDAVSDAWNGAIDWLKIGSPSKRARDEIGYQWGAGIGIGLPIGLNSEQPDIIRGLNNTMTALTPAGMTAGTNWSHYDTNETYNNSRTLNGGVHITVNAAQGQNEDAIADRVMERIYSDFESEYAFA